MSQATLETNTPRKHRAGRWIVIGMILFAAALTATMWAYWKLHIGPFLPLQRALSEKYPGSRPRVEGGQRKMHKATPRILRVTMKIDFDPRTATGKPMLETFSRDVADFVAEVYPPLADYDRLELNFYLPQPETEARPLEVQRAFPAAALLQRRSEPARTSAKTPHG